MLTRLLRRAHPFSAAEPTQSRGETEGRDRGEKKERQRGERGRGWTEVGKTGERRRRDREEHQYQKKNTELQLQLRCV